MKFLSIALFLTLVGCSQQNNPQNSSPVSSSSKELPPVELEAKSYVVTGSTDFGSFDQSAGAKMLSFRITNNGDEALMGPPSIDVATSGFELIYDNCPASLAVKKYCTVKVTFTPKGQAPGSKAANLNLGEVYQELTASINQPPVVVPPSPEELQSRINFGVASLDFGIISEKQNVLKTIQVQNLGPDLSGEEFSFSGSNFSIGYSNCPSNFKKNAKCTLKISLSGAGKDGDLSEDLIFAGAKLPLIAKVVNSASATPPVAGSPLAPNIIFLAGASEVNSAHAFPAVKGSEANQVIFNIKNTGNLATSALSAEMSNTDFQIVYNQCQNKVLAINGQCQIRVAFSASGKAVGAYSASLSFGSASINLTSQVNSSTQPTCASGEHIESGVCMADVKSCTVENGSGTQTWANGAYGACSNIVCSGNAELVSGACVVDSSPLVVGQANLVFNVNQGRTLSISGGTPPYSYQFVNNYVQSGINRSVTTNASVAGNGYVNNNGTYEDSTITDTIIVKDSRPGNPRQKEVVITLNHNPTLTAQVTPNDASQYNGLITLTMNRKMDCSVMNASNLEVYVQGQLFNSEITCNRENRQVTISGPSLTAGNAVEVFVSKNIGISADLKRVYPSAISFGQELPILSAGSTGEKRDLLGSISGLNITGNGNNLAIGINLYKGNSFWGYNTTSFSKFYSFNAQSGLKEIPDSPNYSASKRVEVLSDGTVGLFLYKTNGSTSAHVSFQKLNSSWYTGSFNPSSAQYVNPWATEIPLLNSGSYGSLYSSFVGSIQNTFYLFGTMNVLNTYNGSGVMTTKLFSVNNQGTSSEVASSIPGSQEIANRLEIASDKDFILTVESSNNASIKNRYLKTYKNKVLQNSLTIPSADDMLIESANYDVGSGKFFIIASTSNRQIMKLITVGDGIAFTAPETVFTAATINQNFYGSFGFEAAGKIYLIHGLAASPRRILQMRVKEGGVWGSAINLPNLVNKFDYTDHPKYVRVNNKVYIITGEKFADYYLRAIVKTEFNIDSQSFSAPTIVKSISGSSAYLSNVVGTADNLYIGYYSSEQASLLTHKLSAGVVSCSGGMVSSGNYCSCPTGSFWNKDSASCVNNCPAGSTFEGGRCYCSDSSQYYNNGSNTCENKCPAEATWNAQNNSCDCQAGYQFNSEYGYCEYFDPCMFDPYMCYGGW